MNKHFNQFITNRTEDIWRKSHIYNKELKRIDLEQDKKYQQLELTLNEDQKKLLEDYKDLVTEEISYLRHIIYALGYKDGVNQLNEVDKRIMNYTI